MTDEKPHLGSRTLARPLGTSRPMVELTKGARIVTCDLYTHPLGGEGTLRRRRRDVRYTRLAPSRGFGRGVGPVEGGVSGEGLDDDMNEGKPAVTTGDIAGAFPSLGEAYAFIQPAYDLMVSRFESANGRLAAMLSMTSAVAVGAPVLAATALGADKLRTWPFLISLTLWGLALVAGVIGLNVGKVKDHPPWEPAQGICFLGPCQVSSRTDEPRSR